MNPLLCILRNGLPLTRNANLTFMAQDIGVDVLFIDNDSTDGTAQWLSSLDIHTIRNSPPKGVSESWNQGLGWWFSKGAEYVLCVNNDVALRLDTMRLLVEDEGGFVTAVGNSDPKCILSTTPPTGKRPNPDFSCYLIRRWVWEKVGPFDENFKVGFCEDWDYHLRMERAGIQAYCIDIPFYHVASGTLKCMKEEELAMVQAQATKNREHFKSKYGFEGASPEYYEQFKKEVS